MTGISHKHRTSADQAPMRLAAAVLESLESRRPLSAGDTNFEPLDINIRGFHFDYHDGVTTQADGKILVAGYIGTSGVGNGRDIAVVRVLPTGVLDPSFGSGGLATIALSGDQEAKSIATDTAGRAVVGGTTRNGNFRFAAARFTTSGAPDATFDGDGFATTEFAAGQNALAYAIVAQADQKIVLGGKAFDGTKYELALARFDSNGALDASFDGDGLRTHTAIANTSGEITGMALQNDGRIIAVGTASGAGNPAAANFILARYTDTGADDATFGSSGVVLANFGPGTVAGPVGVALQANGAIVAAGSVTNTVNGNTNFGLARYTFSGVVDNSFDFDGKAQVAFSNSDRGQAIAMQTIGGTQKIVVAGSSGSNGAFAIARLNLNGALDFDFGIGGKVLTQVAFPGNVGVERVPAIAIETLNGPYQSNIITVGVDSFNRVLLTSHDANSVTTNATPDNVWVSDSWSVSVDYGPAGMSNGDVVYDPFTGIVGIFGSDAFDAIAPAIAGVTSNGHVFVSGGADKLFDSATFSLGNSLTIELQDQSLIVRNTAAGNWNGSAYTGLIGRVASGRNGGTWDGAGIVTSMPDAQSPSVLTTLAAAQASDALGIAAAQSTTWRGQTVFGADTLILYTYGGDTNLSGNLDADDYFFIDSNYNKSGTVFGYPVGDFDYSGAINGDDFFIIDFAFAGQGPQLAPPLAASAAPASPELAAAPVALAWSATKITTLNFESFDVDADEVLELEQPTALV